MADPDITIREATVADIEAMRRLQDEAQAVADVTMPHSPGCWRWVVERDGSAQWLAERDAHAIATCRITPPGDDTVMAEVGGSADGIAALVAHAEATGPVDVQERPYALAHAAIEPLLAPVDGPDALNDWYYARVEHLAPLLDRLAPLLVERAGAAGLLDEAHDVLLSSFRSHVRFTVGPDGMSPVISGGPEQAPVSKGGSGVPPDALGPLILGPHGALGLESQLPDAWLGQQRDLDRPRCSHRNAPTFSRTTWPSDGPAFSAAACTPCVHTAAETRMGRLAPRPGLRVLRSPQKR